MLQQDSKLVLTLDIDKSTLISVVTFILGLSQYNEPTLLLVLDLLLGISKRKDIILTKYNTKHGQLILRIKIVSQLLPWVFD